MSRDETRVALELICGQPFLPLAGQNALRLLLDRADGRGLNQAATCSVRGAAGGPLPAKFRIEDIRWDERLNRAAKELDGTASGLKAVRNIARRIRDHAEFFSEAGKYHLMAWRSEIEGIATEPPKSISPLLEAYKYYFEVWCAHLYRAFIASHAKELVQPLGELVFDQFYVACEIRWKNEFLAEFGALLLSAAPKKEPDQIDKVVQDIISRCEYVDPDWGALIYQYASRLPLEYTADALRMRTRRALPQRRER